MESKFKIGDRVHVVGRRKEGAYVYGMEGVVVADRGAGMPLIQFDGWTGGHEGNGHPEFPAVQGRVDCFYVDDDELEMVLVVPTQSLKKTLHPSDKVILKHLKKRRSISPMEALASYGCARLAPRIFNLRRAGYPITTKINRDEPGHRYARYHLAPESTS